jgi:hypothetical protein
MAAHKRPLRSAMRQSYRRQEAQAHGQAVRHVWPKPEYSKAQLERLRAVQSSQALRAPIGCPASLLLAGAPVPVALPVDKPELTHPNHRKHRNRPQSPNERSQPVWPPPLVPRKRRSACKRRVVGRDGLTRLADAVLLDFTNADANASPSSQ